MSNIIQQKRFTNLTRDQLDGKLEDAELGYDLENNKLYIGNNAKSYLVNDEVVVGARNFLRYTDESKFQKNSAEDTPKYIYSYSTATNTLRYNNNAFQITGNSNFGVYTELINNLEPSNFTIVSFEAKGNANTYIKKIALVKMVNNTLTDVCQLYTAPINNSDKIYLTDTMEKYSIDCRDTMTSSSTYTNVGLAILFRNSTTTTVSLHNIQLEYATRASDWRPAIEDEAINIYTVNASMSAYGSGTCNAIIYKNGSIYNTTTITMRVWYLPSENTTWVLSNSILNSSDGSFSFSYGSNSTVTNNTACQQLRVEFYINTNTLITSQVISTIGEGIKTTDIITLYYLKTTNPTVAPAAPQSCPSVSEISNANIWLRTAYVPNTWNSSYRYYTCNWIFYSNNTDGPSTVLPDAALNGANNYSLTALNSANGKSISYYGTGRPHYNETDYVNNPTSNPQNNDLYFRTIESSDNDDDVKLSNNNVDVGGIIIYQFNGIDESWELTRLGGQTLSYLDAGRITTGELNAGRISGGTLNIGSFNTSAPILNSEVSVGGTNLLLRSKDLNSTSWTYENYVSCVYFDDGWVRLIVDRSSNYWGIYQTVQVEPNTDYSLSVYGKAGTSTDIQVRVGFTTGYSGTSIVMNNFSNTGERKTYSFHTNNTQSGNFTVYLCGTVNAVNQYYSFKMPKLEVGNKVTSWSPAPEDSLFDLNTQEGNISNLFNTTQELSNLLNNLSVGGRNILSSSNISGYLQDLTEVEEYTYEQSSVGTGAGIKIPSSLFTTNQDYILSFYFKQISASSNDVYLTSIGGSNPFSPYCTVNQIKINNELCSENNTAWNEQHPVINPIENNKCEIYFTFNGIEDETEEDKDFIYIQPQYGDFFESGSVSVRYWNLQIEQGKIPSEWTPSVEDTNNAIRLAYNTALNAQLDIDSLLEKKELLQHLSFSRTDGLIIDVIKADEQGQTLIDENQSRMHLTNSALALELHGVPVATFGLDSAEINNVEVENEIRIGENWAIRKGQGSGSNFNLNDIWLGGVS